MKKLTGALVLSFSLLLASGCRSAGETKDPGDASTPTSEGSMDASRGALDSGSGSTPTEGAQPTPGGAAGGTAAGSDPAMATPSGTGSDAAPISEEARAAVESCLDKWLNGKKMDRYGHPEGTMYMGGSPLFNEATGESKDRLEYVFARQPEAKKACGSAGTKAPAPKK